MQRFSRSFLALGRAAPLGGAAGARLARPLAGAARGGGGGAVWQGLAGAGGAVRAGGCRGFHGSAAQAFRAGAWSLGRRRGAEEEQDEDKIRYTGEEDGVVGAVGAEGAKEVELGDDDEEDLEDMEGDGFRGRGGRGGPREREHPYPNPHDIPVMPIQETLELKRTATVKKGGKLLSFSAIVCVGNGQGAVSFGKGKHREAVTAIEKATRAAHRWDRMEYFDLYDKRTVMHDVTTRFKKTKVMVLASKEGMGLRAPYVIRKMCECVGIEDIQVKMHGSRNTASMIKAFWNALLEQRTPTEVAKLRGKMVVDTASLRGGYGMGATTFTLPGQAAQGEK